MKPDLMNNDFSKCETDEDVREVINNYFNRFVFSIEKTEWLKMNEQTQLMIANKIKE